MIVLNLKTKNTSQEMIKAYLEENASEALAEKINNGVRIEKDGKQLINRKDLDGFWAYATKEAQKLKEQYVDNDTVYGWAIHYFEEAGIEGKLYNEDGTEYKPKPVPVKKSTVPTTYTPPASKPKPQMSIFDDLLSAKKTETKAPMPEDKDGSESRIEPEMIVDEETGEVLSEPPQKSDDELEELDLKAFDTDALAILDELFGVEIELR